MGVSDAMNDLELFQGLYIWYVNLALEDEISRISFVIAERE